MDHTQQLKRRIRAWLIFFIVCLALSGLTAFPLQMEVELLSEMFGANLEAPLESQSGLQYWLAYIHQGLRDTNARFPFIAYGTDWLAFGHLVIALMFIGPLRDPVRNVWIVTAGMIACVAVIPLALIAGEVREIPMAWRLIDCSFGVLGFVPLWLCRRDIQRLEASPQ